MEEEREKLKKELLSTKESALDTLENSQPIEIVCLRKRAKGIGR